MGVYMIGKAVWGGGGGEARRGGAKGGKGVRATMGHLQTQMQGSIALHC